MTSIEHGGSFVSSFRLRELVPHPPVELHTTDTEILTLDDVRSTVSLYENTNAAPLREIQSNNYEEYIPSHDLYDEPMNDMELQEIIDMSA